MLIFWAAEYKKQNGRLKTKWPPKTKWLPNHKTDHNSLNFQARSHRFCMVVHTDLLQIIHFQKQNGRQIIKLIITYSIFSIIFLWILCFYCNWNSVKILKKKSPFLGFLLPHYYFRAPLLDRLSFKIWWSFIKNWLS